MDPKTEKVALKMAESLDKLNRCQRKTCQGLKKRKDESVITTYKNIAALLDEVDKKKITMKRFKEVSQKMIKKLEESAESVDLMKCALEKCRAEVNKNIDAFQTLLDHECKTTKRCCDALKKPINNIKYAKPEELMRHWMQMSISLQNRH